MLSKGGNERRIDVVNIRTSGRNLNIRISLILIFTEFVVVLSKFAIGDCTVLVNDAPNLHNARHPRGVTSKLDNLNLAIYNELIICSQ